ncbi:hypothetical protein XENORESO_002364 [Xenotaenia resolanae]|uniref:Uncharacterized protein n=1 Tax=Xenotaenia resolanae TaxID=208358 RepID=A0ABV0X801_9TELE
MDAGVHVKGVPTRSRPSVRRETVRDSGMQSAKSLFRNKKELCSVGLELPTRDTPRLTEIHFVCLPGQCEGDEFTQQALSSLPGKLCELLRSLHAHSLRNDEVLLLKDSCRLAEHRDVGPQCWLKAVCVLRQNPCTGTHPQASVASLVGFLGCYVAGVRYVLELQGLQRGLSEPSQPEEDDTNQSVSSIEDDFVTALEHLEEEDTRDNPCKFISGVLGFSRLWGSRKNPTRKLELRDRVENGDKGREVQITILWKIPGVCKALASLYQF